MTLYTVMQVWDAWEEVQEAIILAGMDMSDFNYSEFPRMIDDYLSGQWDEYGDTRQTTLDEFYEEE